MVVVTGGTGFLGAHLLFYLAKDKDKVIATKRKSSNLGYAKRVFNLLGDEKLFEKIEWRDVDLFNVFEIEDCLDNTSEVYHCASEVSFDPRDHEKMVNNNVAITANMADSALAKGVSRFMHVSSIAALGRSTQEEHIDETRIWRTDPVNSKYALSKYKSEMEVWRAHEEGLPVMIVNPAVILGYCPWNEGTGKMFGRVNKGLKYYTEGLTGWVDVKDVAKCMLRLMDEGTIGERYILSGANKQFREIFDLIATELGKPLPSKKVNLSLAKWLVRAEKIRTVFTGNPPLITKETLRNASLKCHYINDKVKDALNYEFISPEETIKEVGSLFKKEAG